MKNAILLLLLMASLGASSQTLYFPPNGSNVWDSVAPASLGWCVDSIQPLYDHLENENSKAFIVLKDGRMVLEKYFGTFTQDSLWYWASAGKTVTSFLVGKVQEDGFLNITDPSSDHLGTGWTSLTIAQEQQITVQHQLSMTTGLDDGVANSDCTLPSCLSYLADPGTRWAYHNAPYTLLTDVVSNASGQGINSYLFNTLTTPIGLYGLFVPTGDLELLVSTPRAMARFGLMMLAGGTWDGNAVINDQVYYQSMITPSQSINNSYGYLWWLNGQSDFMMPGSQIVLPGEIVPQGPADMYCALGKNGQFLCVVPSMNLVVIRMGNGSNSSLVPLILLREIWDHLNTIMCTATSIEEAPVNDAFKLWPNPSAGNSVQLSFSAAMEGTVQLSLFNAEGQELQNMQMTTLGGSLNTSDLAKGIYLIRIRDQKGHIAARRLVVQ